MSKSESVVKDETKLPNVLCAMIWQYLPTCTYNRGYPWALCKSQIVTNLVNGNGVCTDCFEWHLKILRKRNNVAKRRLKAASKGDSPDDFMAKEMACIRARQIEFQQLRDNQPVC